MRTIVHKTSKITEDKWKHFELCENLQVCKDGKTYSNHKEKYHHGHFEDIIQKYYKYTDLLADEKFRMAVKEIRHEIAGQKICRLSLSKITGN